MISFATWYLFEAFGKIYCKDKIIFWNGYVIDRIVYGTSHRIYKEEVDLIVKKKPEILIIATGWKEQLKVEKFVADEFKRNNIEVVIKNTPEAILEFNNLLKKGKKVCILLHITC